MEYRDGMEVELGDQVEVNDEPEAFEPEEATVIKIGKERIRIQYKNSCIKPRKVWVQPTDCELIAREY